MKPKKSWREKLQDSKNLPDYFEPDEVQAKRWGSGRFVIPAPIEVDAFMRKVPKGKVTTSNELRAALAAKHSCASACPITTGIFSWIAAHAAAESQAAGEKRITPYWRTLKVRGEINPKYPGGVAELARLLKAEGHQIVNRGKKFFVRDFEKKLFAFDK